MPDSFVKAEPKAKEALQTSDLRLDSSENASQHKKRKQTQPAMCYLLSESSSSESDSIVVISKTSHTPSLPKNDELSCNTSKHISNSFVKAEHKAAGALQTSHLRCNSSEKAIPKRLLKQNRRARSSSESQSSSSESDAIINSKRSHTPGLPKNYELSCNTSKHTSNSFVKAEHKAAGALQISHSRCNSSEKAVPKRLPKWNRRARLYSDSSCSESDAIINSKRSHTPGLPKNYELSCNTSKHTSNSFVKSERKSTEALQTSHLRRNSSQKAVPKRFLKLNRRAKSSSDSSCSESDAIINSKRSHTPGLHKNYELSCNTIKHTSNSFVEAEHKATEALQTSHFRPNCSEKAFRKRLLKRNKPAARYQSSESSSSESETVAKRKRFHIPSMPNNDELSCNTSKRTSNSQVLTSQDQNTSHENDLSPALFNRLFQYLEGINTRIGELSTKIDQFMSQVENLVSTNSTSMNPAFDNCLPDDVNLPVTSVEELEQLNNKLKSDKEISATLVRFVFNAGYGKTPRPFILSLTRKILAQGVAVQFSRFGRKGKKSFQNYCETMNVILGAAALKFKNTDKQVLAEIFGKCLAGASGWDIKKECSLTLAED